MPILAETVIWMLWNTFLALLPVGFAFLYFQTRRNFYKGVLALLWFLFIPNTLYVMTDMQHLLRHWVYLYPVERFAALLMYAHFEIIGLTAYIVGMFAFEKELRRILKKSREQFALYAIIGMNFLIGFAMVIGKVERVNSWDVFSNTDFVIESVGNVLRSPELMFLALLFGVFGNLFYFLCRDWVVKVVKKTMNEKLSLRFTR